MQSSEISIDLSMMSEKQARFFLAREAFVGYGGARGGGKSWAVRMKAAMLALNYPGIRLLIIRRTLDELRENHVKPMRQTMGAAARWSELEKLMRLGESEIKFGYCDAESDVLRYQGQEYDCIFLDEATQLTEFQFQTFKACIRGVNEYPKRMYITCNPGGVGHEWVKRLFIDREYREGERPEDYAFIQASAYDNKALARYDPTYIDRLKSMDYVHREMWLHGKWDVFAGQFFPAWNRAVHVCAPFPIPSNWRWYMTMDYGMDMLAAYLIAVDTEGRAYVCGEVYEGRDLEGHDGVIISDAAELLKGMAGERDIYQWLAPPDMWNARQETGRSVAEIFAEHGIYLSKAGNERAAGWAAVRERLKIVPDEQGQPTAGLKIFETCPNLIRTLPLMRYDEKRPGEAATEPHEVTHAPDAIRYFCVYWVSAAAEMQAERKRDPIAAMRKRAKRRKI